MPLLNRIGQAVSAAPGTGDIILGAAITSASSGDFVAMGAGQDGQTIDGVLLLDGHAWEIVNGCTYTHATTTLSRGTRESSSTGSAINLSAAAKVYVGLTAGVLTALLAAKSDTSHTHTGTYEPADAGIQSHLANTSNPHGVTAAQAGADPAGTASAAVAAHVAASDPHSQYFGDPTGTPGLGKIIVNDGSANKWVQYLAQLTNTVAPAVSGSPAYGNVLTCSTGTWTGQGSISYAYQWKADGANISGQTSNTYTSVVGDVGKIITCAVTATDLLTSASVGSNGITVTDSPLLTSTFFAPLTASLILTRGTGDPTYSRATSAWEFDNEGKLILVPSGAARFGGARMVRNGVPRSETFLIGWAVNGTATINSATQITLTGSNSNRVSAETGITSPVTIRYKFKAKGAVGGEELSVWNLWSSVKVHTLTTGYVEYTGVLSDSVIDHSQFLGFFSASGSITVDITEIQAENVTGQSDQTASEYVSVGVLSAPYHGAGVDGVKWFNTNKDGSAIAASSLLGYHAEGARTNSLLYSRDLRLSRSTAAMAGGWKSNGISSELISNGEFTTDTSGWTFEEWGTGGSAVVSSGQVTITAGTSNTYLYQTISTVAGKLYRLSFDGVATTDRYNINISGTNSSSAELGYADVSSAGAGGSYSLMFVASGATTYISLRARTNSVSVTTFDNISVKEAEVQVTTCTGIDNAANSASTLTAGAADATILQTLTLAAAARSFSAYVTRRTGVGPVYITRDGFTTEVDISGSLQVGSLADPTKRYRVKIENSSVLNPQVGFKIATSGDAIDVDCVQDDAGAFASSSILTTTASATRNADVLSYPASGNITASAGTVKLMFTPDHAPSGTIVLWGTYVDASNYTQLLHDGTNIIFRRRIAGTNYDATKALAFTAGTAYKIAARWGASGSQIYVDGVAGTGHANASNAQIASTMQIGADGNSANQPYAWIKDAHVWSSALSDADMATVTT